MVGAQQGDNGHRRGSLAAAAEHGRGAFRAVAPGNPSEWWDGPAADELELQGQRRGEYDPQPGGRRLCPHAAAAIRIALDDADRALRGKVVVNLVGVTPEPADLVAKQPGVGSHVEDAPAVDDGAWPPGVAVVLASQVGDGAEVEVGEQAG